MRGFVRRLLAAAAFVPASACAEIGQPALHAPDEPRIAFVSMLDLSRREPLGGLSGIEVAADGVTATAIRDDGLAVEFPLLFNADGRLSGIGAVRAAPLGGIDFDAPKASRDSEALRRLPDGSWLVAYEGDHRVVRHPPGWKGLQNEPERLELPPAVAALPANKGIEAVAVSPDGDLVLIAEVIGEDGLSPVWVRRDGAWEGRRYHAAPAHSPTDAVFLPNGDLLVLERAFSLLLGVRCRLARVPAAEVAGKQTWEGQSLGEVRPPEPEAPDNFEGLALLPGRDGRIGLIAVSDDNFSALQRTLLLQFEFEAQAPADKSAAGGGAG